MFYWVESLQSYNERGWDYLQELRRFVDGGMKDPAFMDAVSGIVNRGCHDPPCGTGPVDGAYERAANFKKVLAVLTSTAATGGGDGGDGGGANRIYYPSRSKVLCLNDGQQAPWRRPADMFASAEVR